MKRSCVQKRQRRCPRLRCLRCLRRLRLRSRRTTCRSDAGDPFRCRRSLRLRRLRSLRLRSRRRSGPFRRRAFKAPSARSPSTRGLPRLPRPWQNLHLHLRHLMKLMNLLLPSLARSGLPLLARRRNSIPSKPEPPVSRPLSRPESRPGGSANSSRYRRGQKRCQDRR